MTSIVCCTLDGGAVDLDRDAAAEKIDVQHETPFGWLVLHEQPFETGERTLGHLDAIAVGEMLVRRTPAHRR